MKKTKIAADNSAAQTESPASVAGELMTAAELAATRAEALPAEPAEEKVPSHEELADRAFREGSTVEKLKRDRDDAEIAETLPATRASLEKIKQAEKVLAEERRTQRLAIEAYHDWESARALANTTAAEIACAEGMLLAIEEKKAERAPWLECFLTTGKCGDGDFTPGTIRFTEHFGAIIAMDRAAEMIGTLLPELRSRLETERAAASELAKRHGLEVE